MASRKGQIYIQLLADNAEFRKALGENTALVKQFSRETASQMRESNAAIALLGENIGVALPRHLRTFVSSLPGVATAMSAAFEGVAVLALIGFVVEAGKKIQEFAQKNQEAAQKLKESQEEFGLTVQKTYNSYKEKMLEAGIHTDELNHNHLAALHKQLELIDMQGFSNLESAFKTLETSADKTFDSIKSNWLSVITQLSFADAAGFKGSLQRFGADYSSLLEQGKGDEAQKLLNETQQREEQNRADLIALRAKGKRSWASAGLVDNDTNAIMERLRSRGITNYSDETYTAANQTTAQLEALQNVAAYQRQQTAADKTSAITQSSKDAQATLFQQLKDEFEKRNIQSQLLTGSPLSKGTSLKYWEDNLNKFDAASKEHTEILKLIVSDLDGIHSQFQKIRDGIKTQAEADEKFFGLDRSFSSLTSTTAEGDNKHAQAVAQLNTEYSKNGEALAKAIIEYQLSTGEISRHDAVLAAATIRQQTFTSELQTLQTELASIVDDTLESADKAQENADKRSAINAKIAAMRSAENAAQLKDAEETQGIVSQIFTNIQKTAKETNDNAVKSFNEALSGVNAQLVGGMTGDRMHFRPIFQNLDRQLLTGQLQNLEGSALKFLGIDKDAKTPQGIFSKAVDQFKAAVDKMLGTGPRNSSTTLSVAGGGSSVTASTASSPIEDLVKGAQSDFTKFTGGAGTAGNFVRSGIGLGLGSLFGQLMHQHTYRPPFQGAGFAYGYPGTGTGEQVVGAERGKRVNNDWSTGLGIASSIFNMAGHNYKGAAPSSVLGQPISIPFDQLQIPAFATGGDVIGGNPILVGERGPEIFNPPSNGSIIPNNKTHSALGGGITIEHIDARGTDAALVNHHVQQAMAATRQQSVHQAKQQMYEASRRTPQF